MVASEGFRHLLGAVLATFRILFSPRSWGLGLRVEPKVIRGFGSLGRSVDGWVKRPVRCGRHHNRSMPSPSLVSPSAPTRLLGIDFTSAPTKRKPITVAHGLCHGAVLRLERVDALPTMAAFESLLLQPGPWLAGCDFPFGLPREFVDSQGLGTDAQTVSAELHRRCDTRMDFRALVDAWGNGRPAGQRLIHRRTDAAMPGISSSSPLQTRYVPVGFMYFEGLSRLLAAGVHLPCQFEGDAARVAVEAYPGLVAFDLIGRRSYKNDASAERLIARKDIVDALEQGRSRLGLRLKMTHAQRESLVDDTSGDRLDAVLALLQAAWSQQQPGYGLPNGVDPVEGWIAGAGVGAIPAPPARAPTKPRLTVKIKTHADATSIKGPGVRKSGVKKAGTTA
jgi:hypothetical protein